MSYCVYEKKGRGVLMRDVCIQTCSWYPDSAEPFYPTSLATGIKSWRRLTSFYNKGTCAQQALDAQRDFHDSQYIMQGSCISAFILSSERVAYRHGHRIVSLGSVIQTIHDFLLSSSHSSEVRPAMASRLSFTTSSIRDGAIDRDDVATDRIEAY
jgi:hypothetical protein